MTAPGLPDLPVSIVVHQLATLVTDTLGPEDCRMDGVGGLRRRLSKPIPNVAGQSARTQAALLLQAHCRLCGKCSLAWE